ncbi:hypothetical protein M569_16700, partial [Genlisea aurea]
EAGQAMGALHFLLNLLSIDDSRGKKRKTMETVEIKVKMDCEGCERRVKNAVRSLRGVKTVEVDRKQSRIAVTGLVDPVKVLKSVQQTGKRAEFWPYIPHNVKHFPHTAQYYDKRAPGGYVKNIQTVVTPQEAMAFVFSEDNPNACVVM